MDRRDFVKMLGLSGALWGMNSFIRPLSIAATTQPKIDIGMCKRLKITCISEVGWWDNAALGENYEQSCRKAKLDEEKCGQYNIALSAPNGAGSSALLEIETLKGKIRRILLDTGWNLDYMTWRFQRTGVDKLLEGKKIDLLVISHEHFDHFYGLEATLKHNPDLAMMIPSTFGPLGKQLIHGADFKQAGVHNSIQHRGKLNLMKEGQAHKLFDGAGLAVFDVPIGADVRGEQSLFFNIKDKGMVLVSGCCHQSITRFVDFIRRQVKGGDRLFGLYGGLHIAPGTGAKDKLTPKQESLVREIGKYGFRQMACNHCTGLPAVKLMRQLGYPVVGGSGSEGSQSDLYLGNSDSVEFSSF